MERSGYGKSIEETLKQCQEFTKTFRGSEETLKIIQHVEECLKKLADEKN